MQPVFGRPSPSASRPGALRASARATDAAYRADGGDTPAWAVRAATVAGVRHRLGGIASDDAYAWRCAGEGLVVAIADGVGSVEDAGLAATAAVEAACDAAASPGRHWDEVMAAAAEAVRAVGGATTLVVAAVDASGRAELARVGDSTAFVLSAGAWHELWAEEKDGGNDDAGSVSTLTDALPSTAAPETAEVRLEPGAALVLMTDGVADPLRDGPSTVAPSLAEALAQPPAPLELLVLADFSRQGCFDDRTILGVWPRPRSEG